MGVTVRQKIPGKGNPWWVFIAHNGNRTSRMVGDKKAAEDVASKIRAKLQLGQFAFEQNEKAPEPTFKEYADAWITRTVPAGCKQSTIRGYADLLRIHVLPVFGALKLSEITKGKIKDFLASKVIDGFSTSSVMHMKNVISGVLNQAVDAEAIQSNLSLGIGKRIVQKATDGEAENGNGNDMADPLTREEGKHLLDTVMTYFPKHYPLFLLLLRTGVRIGEALAVKWADIDFNGRFIHIRRALSRMRIETPKSGKTRRVDMSPQLAETLIAYRTACKRKGIALGLGDLPEYIFTNEKGGFINPDNWRRRAFNKALEKAGIRRIRVHDLRHTYATLRLSKGDNITDVSKQLGHHSVKLTLDIYNHWIPGGKKSEVDALDDAGTEKQEEREAHDEG